MRPWTDDENDIDCASWQQPEIRLADLPRVKLDMPALISAAADIAREEPRVVRDVLASELTDPRLLPHLRRAAMERPQ